MCKTEYEKNNRASKTETEAWEPWPPESLVPAAKSLPKSECALDIYCEQLCLSAVLVSVALEHDSMH